MILKKFTPTTTSQNQKIDAVVPINPNIEKEFDRFNLLIKSLGKYNKNCIGNIYVVSPNKLNYKYDGKLNITYLTERELIGFDFPDNITNYNRQQIIKLLISKCIDTDYYITFDCDNVCYREFSYDDFIINGKSINFSECNETIKNHFDNPEGNYQIDWLNNSSNMLGYGDFNFNEKSIYTVTPAILSKVVVVNILEMFSTTQEFMNKFQDSGSTEYGIYFSYLNANELTQKYYCDGDVTLKGFCVWGEDTLDENEFIKSLNVNNGIFGVLQSTANINLNFVEKNIL